jgi:hypothetical protein
LWFYPSRLIDGSDTYLVICVPGPNHVLSLLTPPLNLSCSNMIPNSRYPGFSTSRVQNSRLTVTISGSRPPYKHPLHPSFFLSSNQPSDYQQPRTNPQPTLNSQPTTNLPKSSTSIHQEPSTWVGVVPSARRSWLITCVFVLTATTRLSSAVLVCCRFRPSSELATNQK